MDHSAGGFAPGFWSGPVVARALARCDFAVLMEEVRRGRGWTQAELAEAVGYSQSWVSKALRGRQALTLDQAREVARRLGIPVHLLRLGEAGGEGPTRRREFGKALALAGLAWPLLAEAGDGAGPALTEVTCALRRLDAALPARELARGAVAHVELADALLRRARAGGGAAVVAAAVSEAAGFAGWLHADMCDLGTARQYYRQAVHAARHAGHDLLAGYMLGSLAVLEIDSGDPAAGLDLAGRAREQIAGAAHPTPAAWVAAVEALGHAALPGGGGAADRALGRVLEAVADDGAMTPPPWPWLFPFDEAKAAGYRALVCVRLGRPDQALAAFAESLAAAQPAPKQRAVVMVEVATAACQQGAAGKDAGQVGEAFSLASQALAAGVRYASERVVQRCRKFRRDYSGPVTAQVREFDDRLRATLA